MSKEKKIDLKFKVRSQKSENAKKQVSMIG